ncbi:acyl-CoA N-acyltransferase [Thelonectria olida]|uniref:Acyl-CoA N-acyltransferase n=1 Tax=Thelonectria olida TaxID=1576542 RepID=A0A9P8VUL3_9HYPO|nr:acyl-CoA N-acyltransferase [Thelonectria olida]
MSRISCVQFVNHLRAIHYHSSYVRNMTAKIEQPVGALVDTTPSLKPSHISLHGKYVSLVPLQAEHAEPSYKHLGGPENAHLWTYMFTGPYEDIGEWKKNEEAKSKKTDPFFFTVLSGPESEPVGQMSLMNIVPDHRRIEIGSVILGEVLKQTRAATEAFFLLLRHAFEDLNYLRVEWKANHLNKPSLSAAERLGFVFEGIFKKHMIIKGRRRDTAWFAISDEDWPQAKRSLEAWLSEDNFDEDGKQRRSLKEVRQSL